MSHEEALAAIERVRALHYKIEYVIPGCSEPQCCGDGESGFECNECGEYYPCTTIEALDGQPSELEHADDCDRAIGCTCGTRTITQAEGEQANDLDESLVFAQRNGWQVSVVKREMP